MNITNTLYQNALEERLDGRFIGAFNQIEQYFRTILRKPANTPFPDLVEEYYKTRPLTPGHTELRTFASLRNVMIHGNTDLDEPLFLPSLTALRQIEEIRNLLLQPECVLPRLGKTVVCVNEDDKVTDVLRKVALHDFSQFPVYNGEKFRGLLTENGITRWMARHVKNGNLQVDVNSETVSDLIRLEEGRGKFCFMDKSTTLSDMLSRFSQEPALEAVLITDSGKSTEPLLGMATLYDLSEIRPFAQRRSR